MLHKASVADVFVIMDDVQYLRREFQNRNRIKVGDERWTWLTVPVDLRSSPSSRICDVLIKQPEPGARAWNLNHWTALKTSYANAPYFTRYREFFEWLWLDQHWERLADLNIAILRQALSWFGITTELVLATGRHFTGRGSDLVMDQAVRLDADLLFAGQLGVNYLDVPAFTAAGVEIVFQDYQHNPYPQRFGKFMSHLSFVDLLFNCGPDAAEIALANNTTREDLCRLRSTR
ncbi:WbqC family protein [soil metagenome]